LPSLKYGSVTQVLFGLRASVLFPPPFFGDLFPPQDQLARCSGVDCTDLAGLFLSAGFYLPFFFFVLGRASLFPLVVVRGGPPTVNTLPGNGILGLGRVCIPIISLAQVDDTPSSPPFLFRTFFFFAWEPFSFLFQASLAVAVFQ